MPILKRIDDALSTIMRSSPVLFIMAAMATVALLIGIAQLLIINAPWVLFTILGIWVVWTLVLFAIKFKEAFKRTQYE